MYDWAKVSPTCQVSDLKNIMATKKAKKYDFIAQLYLFESVLIVHSDDPQTLNQIAQAV